MTEAEPWVPVFAMSDAADNGELIAECVKLKYLAPEWPTLDPTFGNGRFWSEFRPDDLTASDLNPTKSPLGRGVDFRPAMSGFAPKSFRAVVIDPPYKLNGTSGGGGAATSDEDYGVEKWASADDRHELMRLMMTEGRRLLIPARTPVPGTRRTELIGGYLLFKCQDQVNSGRVHWQTRMFADHGEKLGMTLVDMLHLRSYRAQPEKCETCHHTRKAHPQDGRCTKVAKGAPCTCEEFVLDTSQDHARRNYSTLLVFRLVREQEPTPAVENTLFA